MGHMTFSLLYVFMLPAVIVFAIAGAICWKWQSKMARLQEEMDRNRPVDLLRRMSAGCDGWPYPWSSGNRAFDEYRAETLRRLQEEQRELRDFLDRLRHAKDKAEFDQFMAERRNRLLTTLSSADDRQRDRRKPAP